jgi:hypothetical protein
MLLIRPKSELHGVNREKRFKIGAERENKKNSTMFISIVQGFVSPIVDLLRRFSWPFREAATVNRSNARKKEQSIFGLASLLRAYLKTY